MNKTLSILGMSLLTVACSDGGKTDTAGDGSPQSPILTNPESSIIRQIQSSPLLDDGCVNGGSVFEFGFDFNGNGALDDAEVDSERTKILCHGEEGQIGYSAFQIWTMAGNEGSEADFLASLVGTNGVSGDDGSSAYEIWLAAGNTGTEVDFLASLVGTAGHAGTDGLSAYEIWLAAGNAGSEADFLASLEGADGNTGTDGSNGLSAPAITSSSFFYLTENSLSTYEVVAFDNDAADQLTFSLAGGEDIALFDINAHSGVLSFKNSPDFEYPADMDKNNVYEVDLSVTDGTFTTTKALLVKVRDFRVIPKIETVEITSTPADGSIYQDEETIIVTITFDSAVNVLGLPQVALLIGDQVKQSSYVEGTGTNTLTFSYEVLAEDQDTDGVSISENALSLNDGSIDSIDENDGLSASLGFAEVAIDENQKIDNAAPILTDSSIKTRFTQKIPKVGFDNQKAFKVASISLADKDKDGDLDVFYTTDDDDLQKSRWLINNDGQLDQLEFSAEYTARRSVADAGDINGDEFADLVIVKGNQVPDALDPPVNMSIYLSDGTENLIKTNLSFPAIEFSNGNVEIVDLDDDKDFDIVIATARGVEYDWGSDVGLGTGSINYGGRILILINDGSNIFSSDKVHFTGELTSTKGYMLSISDLNNDELPEIIATSADGEDDVIIFKNDSAPDDFNFSIVNPSFKVDSKRKKSITLDVNGDNYKDIIIPGLRTGTNASDLPDDAGYLTLLINNKDMTFTIKDFTDVPSSIGMLGAGDFDGDLIDDFAFKTIGDPLSGTPGYAAWYKGDGNEEFNFTRFNQSYFSTNDAPEASMGLAVGNLHGDGVLHIVSPLGFGADKADSTQACNRCLDVWQNTPSFDIEMFENTAIDTVLATFQADDVDSAVQFSLRGPDIEYFAINESTGELSVTDTLLFEVPDDNAGDATIDEASNKNAAAGDNFYQLSIVISDGHNTVSTPITILVNEVIEEAAEEIIE